MREKNANKFHQKVVGIILILILILSFFSACKADDGSTPLMWQVTAPDGQIMYLFGSIHVGDETIFPLPAAVTDAFDRCDYLAVECDIVAFEQNWTAQMALAENMIYTDGRTVADDIGQELYDKAMAVLTELEPELNLGGVPLGMLDMFKPYMWTSLLSDVAVARSGLSSDYGLDRHFLTEGKAHDMEILEIESAEEQFALLLGFSPPLQMLLLESSLEVDSAAQSLKMLFTLWKQGNEQTLELLLTSDDESMPAKLAKEYNDAMMVRRNLNMAKAAERYMAEGKTVFYVVGLAHMLGEGGIVDLLRQDGYVVERV